MPQKQKQGTKKGRKVGRNLLKCERYRAEGRRERNKRRRTVKLEKKYARNRARREAVKKIVSSLVLVILVSFFSLFNPIQEKYGKADIRVHYRYKDKTMSYVVRERGWVQHNTIIIFGKHKKMPIEKPWKGWRVIGVKPIVVFNS